MAWLNLFRIVDTEQGKVVQVYSSVLWNLAGLALVVLAAYELICVLVWGGSG